MAASERSCLREDDLPVIGPPRLHRGEALHDSEAGRPGLRRQSLFRMRSGNTVANIGTVDGPKSLSPRLDPKGRRRMRLATNASDVAAKGAGSLLDQLRYCEASHRDDGESGCAAMAISRHSRAAAALSRRSASQQRSWSTRTAKAGCRSEHRHSRWPEGRHAGCGESSSASALAYRAKALDDSLRSPLRGRSRSSPGQALRAFCALRTCPACGTTIRGLAWQWPRFRRSGASAGGWVGRVPFIQAATLFRSQRRGRGWGGS